MNTSFAMRANLRLAATKDVDQATTVGICEGTGTAFVLTKGTTCALTVGVRCDGRRDEVDRKSLSEKVIDTIHPYI